jgi:hypothetical protein
MSSPNPSLISRLVKYLPIAEVFFLGGLIVGLILNALKIDGMSLIKFCLPGLAIIYFLSAYKPADLPTDENNPLGFSELLSLSILPKVMWISATVLTIGVLFYLLKNEGYKQMLMIGCLSMGSSLLILLILFLSRSKHLNNCASVLLRGIPLLATGAYILFK